jgi:hypothetical protein
VGSSLHITQGLEILSLRVEAPGAGGPPGSRVQIELRDLGRPAEGELWFALPGGEIRVMPVAARGQTIIEFPTLPAG